MDDASDIAAFYDIEANRMKLFDPMTVNTEVELTGMFVPKMPLIPAEVALKVATNPTMPR